MGKIIDLTGKVFGKLKVVQRNSCNKWTQASWDCQCTCSAGTLVLAIAGSDLRRARIKSCGCLKSSDILNCRFGTLTVIKHVGSSKHQKSKWLCRCDCGEEIIRTAPDLLRGDVTRCKTCRRFLSTYDTNPNYKHGENRTQRYDRWCSFPQAKGGGRSEKWARFESFREWCIANGWLEGTKFKRIDINKPWGPDNCILIKPKTLF